MSPDADDPREHHAAVARTLAAAAEHAQEDRYHAMKAAVEDALEQPLTNDQANQLFFRVLEPLLARARSAERRLDDVADAATDLTALAHGERTR
jgi:alpha-D-ribose 1-methylphosphonate 5-triphosphate synthase subunit PhnG